VLPDPKGERTGKACTEPTSITPIDPASEHSYDGPGQVGTRLPGALDESSGSEKPILDVMCRRPYYGFAGVPRCRCASRGGSAPDAVERMLLVLSDEVYIAPGDIEIKLTS